jgi:chromosome segregation ATPase
LASTAEAFDAQKTKAEDVEIENNLLRGEAEDLRVIQAELKENLAALKGDFDEKNEIIREMGEEMKVRVAEVTKLETQVTTLNTHVTEIETVRMTLIEVADEGEGQKERLRKQVEELNEELNEKTQGLVWEVEEGLKRLKSSENERMRMEGELEEVMVRNEEFETEVSELKTLVEQNEETVGCLADQVGERQTEITQLGDQLGELMMTNEELNEKS